MTRALLPGFLLLAALGCASSPIGGEEESEGRAELLRLSVGPDQRAFIELSRSVALKLPADGRESLAWDLALQGRSIFTNGGVSGPGSAAAFGPLSAPTFLSDTAPDTPRLFTDRAGGALIDWYFYAGNTHRVLSRYHVYGLRDGERLFKLQLLDYYETKEAALVSAQYRIRFAEVFPDGSRGETREVAGIDASVSTGTGPADTPSACLDLDSPEVLALTVAEAAARRDWHLCFRREAVAVNGGVSGPRGVEAVDLQAADTPSETQQQIEERDVATELPAFDAVDHEVLSDPTLAWQADGVATAFGARWLEPGPPPLRPSDSVWLVIAADGVSKYLLRFEELRGDPARGPAQLSLRSKPVR